MNAIEPSARIRIAITLGVLALSAWLAQLHFPRAMRYLMVDELATAVDLEDRPLDVHGYVQAGSIAGDDRGRTFVLTRHGHALRVFVAGPVPDRFRDQAEVIVAGALVPPAERRAEAARLGVALDAAPVLAGERMMMKCAVRYGDDAPSRSPARFE